MIAWPQVIPALAQHGWSSRAAGVAKKFYIVPMIIFGYLRAFADSLQHTHIGLMTDKDKAIAIQGVVLLQHADGFRCLSNGKALDGVPLLLEVTHAGYAYLVPL